MHLLNAPTQTSLDGEAAVDLGLPPGDLIVLSAADTELSALNTARMNLGGGAPDLRLANLQNFRHPYSVDLFVEQTLAGARLVVVRVLGGRTYWEYAVDRLVAWARGSGGKLVLLSGERAWDEELAALSNVRGEELRRLFDYFDEGGPANMEAALSYCAGLLGGPQNASEPQTVPVAGLYRGKPRDASRPVAAIVFYRALLQGGSQQPVDALIAALEEAGVAALPIYVSSLKDPESIAIIEQLLGETPPDLVINATAFAVSKAGVPHQPTVLDRPGRPVLQVVFAGSAVEAWQQSPVGLSAQDLAMHVVLPELDGRVLTRAVSFKTKAEPDPHTGYASTRYDSLSDRIEFVAQLAAATIALSKTPAKARRVAILLANYPNKDGRLANGVGLDTPASAVNLMAAMGQDGMSVKGAPHTAGDLMALLVAGVTNAAGKVTDPARSLTFPVAEYQAILATYPREVRNRISDRWGAPEDDPNVVAGAFQLPCHRFENVVVAVQPARGYNIDPKATYHDPDLVPPHNYLATYFWLRHEFAMHAIVHLGKHGNLEWLPGKAVGLSATCWPEVALGPVPNFYPFIVNDPGEGAQAKRRNAAVIIDHLTPPMTRAESYGAQSELESLVDEYYLAAGLDPRRTDLLGRQIVDLARRERIDKDIGLDPQANIGEALNLIDAFLCDLKELQIRDGLHVLGVSPEGRLQTDTLVALARVPRGSRPADASLLRALASDLALQQFDPLDCDMAAPFEGSHVTALADLTDAPWRSNGDTLERLELLAARLVEGGGAVDPEWQATRAVLDEVNGRLRPALECCGADEMKAMMGGLAGAFVAPGPSGAPTRGRPDVLPTGRNFYSVDARAVPTQAAWTLGCKSAQRLMERHYHDHGEWPRAMALSAWGTSNMRTGGDDIAQAMALIGVQPVWDRHGGRVTGFTVMTLGEMQRPRVDVTLRISGFFRDAFPYQIALFDNAVQAVAQLDEPADANPLAERVSRQAGELEETGMARDQAVRQASYRIFGSMPGAYGAGLQALIDENLWHERADFAQAFLTWGGYAYGAGQHGEAHRDLLARRLAGVDAVVHNQDNREHDLLDSDDYYQFEGGLSAAVEHLSGQEPAVYHNDHSRPERPVIRTLNEEISRVVRGRAANPKWIAGVMRHGYKGAFEIAATVDYLFAFAATTNSVASHHFDQLHDAYLHDPAVRDFLASENPDALREIALRFCEAVDRGLWAPQRNSTYGILRELAVDPANEEVSYGT